MSYKPNVRVAGCVLKFELHSIRVELEVELDQEFILDSLDSITQGIADLGAKDINHLPTTPAKDSQPTKTGTKITCSNCGNDDYVAFKPTRKHILCNECYTKGIK